MGDCSISWQDIALSDKSRQSDIYFMFFSSPVLQIVSGSYDVFFCSKRWWWRLNGPVTSREEEVSAIASIENPIKTEIKHRLSHPFPSIIFVFVSIRLSTIIANAHTHLFTIAVFFSEICRQLKFSFYEKSQK